MGESTEPERAGSAFMGEIFEAIGFEVPDEDAYNLLAEYAENSGQRSSIHRGGLTLHGRCWKLGEGIEVWSVLYESAAEHYYADCRPAFRSRYLHTINPWELAEYDEDGEALVRGSISEATEVVFELQNLTEVDRAAFREGHLQVALAGLSSSVRAHSRGLPGSLHSFRLASTFPEYAEGSCENDYVITGNLLAWRRIRNPITGTELVWIYVDATGIRLELLASRKALRGRLKVGAALTARIWLQGHILEQTEISARFEGVDPDSLRSDFWAGLRKGN